MSVRPIFLLAGLANAWIGLVLFDVLIFGMTLFKSWGRGYAGGRSFFKLLLRDGAIYFGIMAIAELVNILTFHLVKYIDLEAHAQPA
ncbi:hypothetical protein DXG01_009378 [Tephrocybe rancida]|nr:hypothetical protein DXG01_009378 [Tephrocybe rancida]